MKGLRPQNGVLINRCLRGELEFLPGMIAQSLSEFPRSKKKSLSKSRDVKERLWVVEALVLSQYGFCQFGPLFWSWHGDNCHLLVN